MTSQTQQSNRIFITVLTLITLGSFYLLSSILAPFLAGALIAYLCDPLVRRLMKFHINRILAVTIVFLTAFLGTMLFLIFLIPLIEKQVMYFIGQVPDMVTWTTVKAKWFMNYYNISISPDETTLKKFFADYITKAGGFVNWMIQTTLTSGKTIFEVLVYLVLIPLVTFYLLRDWDRVLLGIDKILPQKIKPKIVAIAKECDEVTSAFFRGQLLVMLSLGFYYSVTLSLMGLNVGVIIGLIIALLSIIPYLGSMIGILIAAITAYMQFGDLEHLMWLALIFVVGHIMENFILTPLLIGNRVGLHPVAVIFAILAGGTLFGFFGVLLAIPSAAIITILLRHLLKPYHKAVDNLG